MSNKKIKVDAANLDVDIEMLRQTLEDYLKFWQLVSNGIGSILNGMCPVLQRNNPIPQASPFDGSRFE